MAWRLGVRSGGFFALNFVCLARTSRRPLGLAVFVVALLDPSGLDRCLSRSTVNQSVLLLLYIKCYTGITHTRFYARFRQRPLSMSPTVALHRTHR